MVEAGRVIAGAAKGIRLVAPGEGTRPLSDRVKESLFGALEAEGVVGPGRAFLDLFAGSGAGGIEALSRGSERAVFVEQDTGACRVIGDNIERTRLVGAVLVRADVLQFLEGQKANERPFDAVLVDPPYGSGSLEPALALLADSERGWLTFDAVVIAKHFWRDAPPSKTGILERKRERRFGETALTVYGIDEATQATIRRATVLTSENAARELAALFPEIGSSVRQTVEEYSEEPIPLFVVFMPFESLMGDALTRGDDHSVARVFDFLERMSSSPDERVQSVADVGVLEYLLGWGRAADLRRAEGAMGPATLTLYRFLQATGRFRPPRK